MAAGALAFFDDPYEAVDQSYDTDDVYREIDSFLNENFPEFNEGFELLARL